MYSSSMDKRRKKKQLIESVERPHLKLKDVDWQSIADLYEDRTPTSCQQKYYEIKKKRKTSTNTINYNHIPGTISND